MVGSGSTGRKKKQESGKAPDSKNNDLIGMKDICDYVNRSSPTVLSMIRDMGFPAVKVGGIWESSRGKIAEWRERFYA